MTWHLSDIGPFSSSAADVDAMMASSSPSDGEPDVGSDGSSADVGCSRLLREALHGSAAARRLVSPKALRKSDDILFL